MPSKTSLHPPGVCRIFQIRSAPGSIVLAAALAFLGGCAQLDPRKDADYQSYAPTADRPVVRPVRSISSFNESLFCMDHMLRAAEVPTTLITAKQFPDYSGKVPAATKDMMITALSRMSRLSNAFRYVDYEVNLVTQDTVQNLTTILLNNNQMQLQRPALYISGAVSFVDQGVFSNTASMGLASDRVNLGYNRNRNVTLLGLEMHLGDFRTRTLLPGMDSANEVVFGSSSQGIDAAATIGIYGVRFTLGRDYTQGTGGALRTLVDLAAVELAGKWARVPYWQCLMLDQTNPNFQRQMRDWYDESGPAGQLRLVQNSLLMQGYLPSSARGVAANSLIMRNALSKFQSDQGVVVTGTLDFPTYERALRNFVELDESGTLTRVGWSNLHSLQVADGETSSGVHTTEPWMIDLQIENPQPAGERPAFAEGEQVFLSATVSRTSYLYCYFSDSAGNVMRLLPNAITPNALTPANQALRIPDWMASNPGFLLDAGKPGTEAVLCVATAEDASTVLPPELQVPALTVLKDVKGVQGMQERFASVLGKDKFVTQVLQWMVVPKLPVTTPATTSPATGTKSST